MWQAREITEMYIEFWWGDLGVEDKIILKWALQK
jgi:hypothetical protein